MCTPRVIKSRRLRWAGYVACMGTLQNAYNISVCKPEGMIPLGRLKYRWENDTKIDLKGTGYEGVNRIQVAPVVGPSEHSNEPSGYIKGRKYLD